MKIKCSDTNEVAYSYAEYLTTQHWKKIREVVFQKSDGYCCSCKKPLSNNFIAHHRTYYRIGNERIRIIPYSKKFLVRIFQKLQKDDVVAVCRYCHNGKSNNHKKLHEFVRVPEWARIENEY